MVKFEDLEINNEYYSVMKDVEEVDNKNITWKQENLIKIISIEKKRYSYIITYNTRNFRDLIDFFCIEKSEYNDGSSCVTFYTPFYKVIPAVNSIMKLPIAEDIQRYILSEYFDKPVLDYYLKTIENKKSK